MEYPGFNSFWNLSEEIIGLLLSKAPLSTQQIFEGLKHNGLGAVDLHYRTQVPLALDHIITVLTEHLSENVVHSANGWEIVQRPLLPPVWNMFPYPLGSLGYRMGRGEKYWKKWENWYLKLDEASKLAYRDRYPEPDSWRHFYEMVSTNPRDFDAMDAVIKKVQAAEAAFISSEYKRACMCEERGEIDKAMYHFMQVSMRGDQFPDARARYESLLAREHDGDAN